MCPTAITALLTRNHGNIVSLDQYSDNPEGGAFFQQVVFYRKDLAARLPDIRVDLGETLQPLGMEWKLVDQSVPKRMAILASTSDHCLLELLWQHRRGVLPVTIPMVISNHTNTEDDVRSFGIPFHHVESGGQDKTAAEATILGLLQGNVDFVVLARHMQICRVNCCGDWRCRSSTSTTPSCLPSSVLRPIAEPRSEG